MVFFLVFFIRINDFQASLNVILDMLSLHFEAKFEPHDYCKNHSYLQKTCDFVYYLNKQWLTNHCRLDNQKVMKT